MSVAEIEKKIGEMSTAELEQVERAISARLQKLRKERNDFHRLAASALADSYGSDEVEYTVADLKS